jgi:hypothetical protein
MMHVTCGQQVHHHHSVAPPFLVIDNKLEETPTFESPTSWQVNNLFLVTSGIQVGFCVFALGKIPSFVVSSTLKEKGYKHTITDLPLLLPCSRLV